MANLNISTDDEEDEVLARIESFVMNDLLASSPVLNVFPELLNNETPTRNQEYYEVTIPGYTLDEFREHFRMSRSSFSDLIINVGNRKRIVGLELKLLYTVWTLSKQESFLSSGDRFNLAKSSAHNCFCEILDVICSMTKDYIKWPSISQYNSISQEFREKSGGYIPGIVGPIDGCHIQIKQPVNNPIDYYNRKNTHSVILQAVCDHRTVFTDIYVGAPGRLHDARVYRNSPLHDQINELIPGEYHILGDSAYPLSRNVITPFRDNGHLLEKQLHFNTRHSSARVAIERAFGFLKGRFRRLKYLDVSEPIMANKIVTACCILHNHIQSHSHEDFVNADIEIEYDPVSEPVDNIDVPTNERGINSQKRNFLLSLFKKKKCTNT